MKLTPFDPANYIKTPEDLRYYLEALADPFDAVHYARSIDSVVLAFENLRNAAFEEAAKACEAHMSQCLEDRDIQKRWPEIKARNAVYAQAIRDMKDRT